MGSCDRNKTCGKPRNGMGYVCVHRELKCAVACTGVLFALMVASLAGMHVLLQHLGAEHQAACLFLRIPYIIKSSPSVQNLCWCVSTILAPSNGDASTLLRPILLGKHTPFLPVLFL